MFNVCEDGDILIKLYKEKVLLLEDENKTDKVH